MKRFHLKRTFLAVTAAALFVPAAIGLTACNGEKEQNADKQITGISLSYTPGDTYVVGETVREPYNNIKLAYDDGSTETIPATSAGVTISGDTSTVGEHTGTISYAGFSIDFDYTVYPVLDDTLEIASGTIQGYTTLDGEIQMYKGIPYAAPPVGNLRWHAPQDVEPWDGVLECYHFGPAPIQNVRNNDDYLVNPWDGTSEDCLTMSVWTSGTETADKPVLVFIYGGGNTAGGTSVPIYDGTAMAREDIVVVTFNYRLGLYGFLATDELKSEGDGCGNFAILDQIKALEWVQENIAAFGGDKNNVTIMGQSAGGSSVEMLISTPLAVGLFRNAAVLSSGMYFTGDTSTVDDIIARFNNNNTENYSIADLRAMTVDELDAAVKINSWGPSYDDYVLVQPTIRDSYRNGTGSSTSVNLLLGTVTGDSTLYGDIRNRTDMEVWESITAQRNLAILTRLAGGATGSNYLYHYDYIQNGADSAGHTDDVTFWLNNTTGKYGGWSETDAAVAKVLSSYLVNFCRTGNPNGEGLAEWTESTGDYGYMYLHGSSYEYRYLSPEKIAVFEADYSEFKELY